MEPKLTRLMRRVRDTQESEIDCSACLDEISRYVELELADGEVERTMPLVHQHLHQCTVCFEEYQVLRELARLEASDDLPSPETLLAQLKRDPDADE